MKIKMNKGTTALLEAVSRLALIRGWGNSYGAGADDPKCADAVATLISAIVGGAKAAVSNKYGKATNTLDTGPGSCIRDYMILAARTTPTAMCEEAEYKIMDEVCRMLTSRGVDEIAAEQTKEEKASGLQPVAA